MRILNSLDIKEDLVTFFKNKSLIPIVGSGISCGVPTNKGSIPSGLDYKQHMVQTLLDNPQFTDDERSELEHEKFSALCDYYEDDENVSAEHRFSYLRENFYHARYADDDIRRSFFDIKWSYIYSLNIDDAIERSTNRRERRQRASRGITNFLNYVYANLDALPISSDERTKINNLINFLEFGKVTTQISN